MRKIFTFVAAAAVAASAVGQNVIVVMKDGTSHKFNADYLSEIRFTEAEENVVNFTELGIDVYSYGNATLTFKDATGENVAVCDIYGPTDASYLTAGTYNVEKTYKPFTVDPGYSELTIAGETLDLASGTLEISVEGQEYTCKMDLFADNGQELIGKWSGKLDVYSPWLAMEMTSASYNENEQLPGDFYVKFVGANGNWEMAIVFTANEEDTVLPTGHYTYSADAKLPFTFGSGSYLDMYRPYSSNRFLEGSTVDVEKDGDNYTITMALNLRDGRTADVSYKGQISGTPTFSTGAEEIVFDTLTYQVFGAGNFCPKLVGEQGTMELDMYGNSTSAYLMPGTYVVGATEGYSIDTGDWSIFTGTDGVKQYIDGGKCVVSLDGDVYTFEFDFVTKSGHALKGSWSGKLGGLYTPVIETSLLRAEYLSNPQEKGEFYVKLTGNIPSIEMAIDFFAATDAELLPAGTYTLSDDNTPGTFSAKSYMDTFGPYSNNHFLEGSTVTVSKEGNEYTLEMNLNLEDGRKAILTYKDEIFGTPSFKE